MSTTPTRVAIVDDHACVRKALRLLLETMPELVVVLDAEDGLDYERQVAEVGHVHVAVVDLSMPRRDGYETMRWITRHHPRTRCLAFSYLTNALVNRRAMRADARGVINKTCRPEELLRAIQDVARNDFHYNQEVTKALRLRWEDEDQLEQRDMDRIVSELAPREKEFLLLYARYPFPSLKEMEVKLGLKPGGVEDLRKRSVERTKCATRELMMDFLQKTGLK